MKSSFTCPYFFMSCFKTSSANSAKSLRKVDLKKSSSAGDHDPPFRGVLDDPLRGVLNDPLRGVLDDPLRLFMSIPQKISKNPKRRVYVFVILNSLSL